MAFEYKGVSMTLQWGNTSFSGTIYEVPAAAFKAMGDALEGAMQDLQPVWQKVVKEVLEPAIHEQFTTAGAYLNGAPWAELKSETVRRRHGAEHPILQRSTHLMDSFAEGGPDHVEEYTPEGVEWGSTVPYGGIHQDGDMPRMEQRRIITVSETLEERITTAVKEGIDAKLREAGFNVTP